MFFLTLFVTLSLMLVLVLAAPIMVIFYIRYLQWLVRLAGA